MNQGAFDPHHQRRGLPSGTRPGPAAAPVPQRPKPVRKRSSKPPITSTA